MNRHQAAFYPESTFGGFTDVDGTLAFYARINSLITPTSVVVDCGCGRGHHAEDPIRFRRELRCLKTKVSSVIGLDVDAAAAANPTVDEFRQIAPGSPWPLDDNSVSLVISDCVLEHLPDPGSFFAEAKRVLKRGGYLCVRTPNAFGYVGLISRIVPNRYHATAISKIESNRKEEDVFPTLYRCNTVSALRRQLRQHGFRSVVYGYDAEPSYLNFSGLLYGCGVLYAKFAPGVLKNAIFAFGESI